MKKENKEWWHHAHVRPSDEDIREAVRLYEEEGLTLREIGKKFDRSQSRIHEWINKFAKDLDNPEMSKKRLKAFKQRERAQRRCGVVAPEDSSQTTGSVQEERLEDKVRRLEEELRKTRLMRDFYDEMINVAEEQFHIKIRKKVGTRQ